MEAGFGGHSRVTRSVNGLLRSSGRPKSVQLERAWFGPTHIIEKPMPARTTRLVDHGGTGKLMNSVGKRISDRSRTSTCPGAHTGRLPNDCSS